MSSATTAPPRTRTASHASSNRDSATQESTRFGGWLQRLDSPVTSYYVLLSVTVVLVVIGLIMVLSASSVKSLVQTDNEHDGQRYIDRIFSAGDSRVSPTPPL